MSKLVQQATNELREAIEAAIKAAVADGSLPEADIPAFTLEVPADRSHGDWACNAAMAGARASDSAGMRVIISAGAASGSWDSSSMRATA